jgi:hypothetical protein
VALAGISAAGHQLGRFADAMASAHASSPHAGLLAYAASALLTLVVVGALARRMLHGWAAFHEGSRTLSRRTFRQLRSLSVPAITLAYFAGLAAAGAVDIALSLAATAAGQPVPPAALQLALAMAVPGCMLAYSTTCVRFVSEFARRDAWRPA